MKTDDFFFDISNKITSEVLRKRKKILQNHDLHRPKEANERILETYHKLDINLINL